MLHWARRIKAERTLAILLLAGGLTSGIATFVAMTGNLSVAANADQILLLLLIDLVVILGLAVLIVRRLSILWIERKKGRAGSRLHGRLVALFSVVAVTPTILVAAFSVIMFDLGLEFWFSERVSSAIKNSRAVAAAYLTSISKQSPRMPWPLPRFSTKVGRRWLTIRSYSTTS